MITCYQLSFTSTDDAKTPPELYRSLIFVSDYSRGVCTGTGLGACYHNVLSIQFLFGCSYKADTCVYVFLLVSFHAPNNLFEDYLVWQADIVQSIFVISKTLEFRYYEYRYVINFIGRQLSYQLFLIAL